MVKILNDVSIELMKISPKFVLECLTLLMKKKDHYANCELSYLKSVLNIFRFGNETQLSVCVCFPPVDLFYNYCLCL